MIDHRAPGGVHQRSGADRDGKARVFAVRAPGARIFVTEGDDFGWLRMPWGTPVTGSAECAALRAVPLGRVGGVVIVEGGIPVALAHALAVGGTGLIRPPAGDDHQGQAFLGLLVVEDQVVAAVAERFGVPVPAL